MSFQKQAQWAR